MKRVFVDGVGNVEYPDDWSDEAIQKHIAKHLPAWQPTPQPEAPLPAESNVPQGFLSNLKGGFLAAAGPGNLSTYSAALASAADALGYGDTRDMLLQYSKDQGDEAGKIPVDPVRFSELLEQPNVLASFRNWVGRSIGSAAGSTLGPLAGGLSGAVVGGAIGGPPGAGIGALVGGGLAAQQMGAGDVMSEIASKGDPAGQGLRAQAWGVPYGLTEMALGPEAAAIGKYVLPTILKSSALSPTTKQGLVRTAIKSSGQEAIANPLQELMVMEAAREAQGAPFESLMEAPNGWRLLDAAAEGAVGGAALGGAVGALPGGRRLTPPPSTEQTPVISEAPPPALPPLTQDNINQNPYGAVNENFTPPFTGITPPVSEADTPFTGEGYNFKLPKGSEVTPSVVPAEANLAEARAIAQTALARRKTKPSKAPTDEVATLPEMQRETLQERPATKKAKAVVPPYEGPRFTVNPVGEGNQEQFSVVDNSKRERSPKRVLGVYDTPEQAQDLADRKNREFSPSPLPASVQQDIVQEAPTHTVQLPAKTVEAPSVSPELPPKNVPSTVPTQERTIPLPEVSKLPQVAAEKVTPATQLEELPTKSSETDASVTPDKDTTGLAELGTGMAGGIRDGAIDSLWKSVQTGRWAISPEKAGYLEQVVDKLRKAGKIKSREDVAKLYDKGITTKQAAIDAVKSSETVASATPNQRPSAATLPETAPLTKEQDSPSALPQSPTQPVLEKSQPSTTPSNELALNALGRYVRKEGDFAVEKDGTIKMDGKFIVKTKTDPTERDVVRAVMQQIKEGNNPFPSSPEAMSLDEFSIAFELGNKFPEFEISNREIGTIIKPNKAGIFQTDIRELYKKVQSSKSPEAKKPKESPRDVKEMRGEVQPNLKVLPDGRTYDPTAFPSKLPIDLLDHLSKRKLYDSLRKHLDSAGFKDVTLNLRQFIRSPETGKIQPHTFGAYWSKEGAPFGLDKIVQIAHGISSTSYTPETALNHEIVHILKDLDLFTPQEWAYLEAKSKSEWVEKYRTDIRYEKQPEFQLEEGIAEAGREYYSGLEDFTPRTKTLFEKIRNFLRTIKAWWNGDEDFSPEKIFDKAIERSRKRGKTLSTENRSSPLTEEQRDYEDSLQHGYMDKAFFEEQIKSLRPALEPKLLSIAEATDAILGNPKKIGPIRQGVYSGWVNLLREKIQTSRGLGSANPWAMALYGKTSLRYSTSKSILDGAIGEWHNGFLGKTATKAIQDKAGAVLEIWDWKKERPEITGPLAVTNDIGDLDYSKKGETIVLRSSEELAALKALMRGNDLILTQMMHAVLKNLGVDDPNITPFEAKAKYDALKEERDALPKSKRGEKKQELDRWRKITSELVGFDRLSKQGYLPRIRFGNAAVGVWKIDEEGNRELIAMPTIEGIDTRIKAYLRSGKVAALIKDLKSRYKESDGYEVSNEAFPLTHNSIAELIRQRLQNRNNPYDTLLDNIPLVLTMLNSQQLEKLQDGNIKEVQNYLERHLTSGTVAKHMLEAKKILGADTELPRVLGQYGLSMSNGIAKMQTGPLERNALVNILNTNDIKLINWATDYMNYMDNPNEEWNRMKSLGFIWNLGYNLASAVLNFANIASMYGPYVSQWATGTLPVTRSLANATKTAGQIMGHTIKTIFKDGRPKLDNLPNPELLIALNDDLVKKGIVSKDLYDYLVQLNKDGVLDHGLSLEQLGAQPEYGNVLPEHMAGKLWQKGVRSAATFFRWTEAMARLTSAISLYELMQNPKFMEKFEQSEKGKYVWQEESGGDPVKGEVGETTIHNIAKYILKDTFGDYDKANRPAFMKGFWGVVNQFSQYPVMMMETMFAHLKPFTKKEDAKTVAKMLGVAFLLSGLSGFAPGSDDLRRIFEKLYSVFTGGKKLDIEKEMLELMVERAGVDPGLARDIMYGPYRAIPGIENIPLVGSADIGKRIALNTVPAIDTMLNVFAGNAQVSPITGPAGIAARFSDTWDAYHRGTPYALTNLLPTAFHNTSQGFLEWADTGVRNRYNNVIIDPAVEGPLALSGNDYAAKIIGFTPQKVSTARLMDRFERDITDSTKDIKSRYRSELMVTMQQQLMANKRGDESRYRAATERIKDLMKEIIEHDRGRPLADRIGIQPKDFGSIRREALDSLGTALKTEKRTPQAKRPEVAQMRERLFPDTKP